MQAASELLTRARFAQSGVLFPDLIPADRAESFNAALPSHLAEFLREHGGNEGFLGGEYLRLFRLEELATANESYEIGTKLPGLIVFGSNGGGEAYGLADDGSTIFRIPFIPMDPDYLEVVAEDLEEWIQQLAASGESPAINLDLLGKEVTEKHPVCLGGSPTEESNKLVIDQATHTEMARFWNKIYASVKAQSEQGSAS